MTDVSAVSRVRIRLAFWALAGLALLAAHDAIYLVQVGPGEALVDVLRTAGHGYWAWASLGLTAVAVVSGLSIWLRMRRLHRRASSLDARPAASRPFARRLPGAWWRLVAIVAIGFLVQENVEHLIAHGHAPGIGALLGPELPLALPVICIISAIAAVLATLVGGAHEALVVAIQVALARQVKAPREVAQPPARRPAAFGSILARRGAGRAPPSLVVSAT